MQHAHLERMAELVRATAEHDLAEAQRLAAVAVVQAVRADGATAELGDRDGLATAEVRGTDGRWLVIAPLVSWDPNAEPPSEGPDGPGVWEYGVRDVDGTLLFRPDGDGAPERPATWHRADHGLALAVGLHERGLVQDLMESHLGWTPAVGEHDPVRRLVPGEPAASYAPSPYPGERPAGSFVIDTDGLCWPVRPDDSQPSGWCVEDDAGARCLDAWLAEREATPLSERVPLLGYGSNACPGKVLRNGTPLPAVHLAATMTDLASAWCTGETRAGHTPVTLVAAPGHVEEAVMMMVDGAELHELDRVEGRSVGRYHLVLLEEGRVVMENGEHVPHPAAYVGASGFRVPVLMAGRPLLRADLDLAQSTLLRAVVPTVEGDGAPLGRVVPASTHPKPADCVADPVSPPTDAVPRTAWRFSRTAPDPGEQR